MSVATNKKRLFSPLIRSFGVTVLYLVPTFLILLPYQSQKLFPQFSKAVPFTLLCLIYLAYTWFFTRIIDRRPWSVLELKLDKHALQGFMLSLLLTAFLVILGAGVSVLIFHDYFSGNSFSLPNLWQSFALSFLLQGFPEEIVFRGYMIQTLERKPLPALWISSSLFALMHIVHIFPSLGGSIAGLFNVFYAFCFGLLACLLKYLFRTTWAAVAVHGGMHMTREILSMLGLTPSMPLLINGLLMLLTAAWLLYHYRDRLKSWESIQSASFFR
ncbi:lysostaphin resistance A-like protein [Streptococcus sp. H31]|uniref:CPBP family intramembrane glutamic endopeptidase n=1 Tax=Streptococcus huangxiaojuni TaxID=3237239 RepID=UPI0034A16B76